MPTPIFVPGTSLTQAISVNRLSTHALSPVVKPRLGGIGVCTPLIPRSGEGLTGPGNGTLVSTEQILPLWL
jgi:hypothetical protein